MQPLSWPARRRLRRRWCRRSTLLTLSAAQTFEAHLRMPLSSRRGGVIGAQVTPGAEPIKGSQGNVTGGGSSSATIMTDPWVDSGAPALF